MRHLFSTCSGRWLPAGTLLLVVAWTLSFALPGLRDRQASAGPFTEPRSTKPGKATAGEELTPNPKREATGLPPGRPTPAGESTESPRSNARHDALGHPRTPDRGDFQKSETSNAPESASRTRRAGFDPEVIRQWAERIRRLGPVAPAVFVVLFVANTVFGLPTSPLTTLGGFLFGAARGFLYVWIGALLGASAAFGLSRKLGRRWIQARLSGRPLLQAIEQAVSEEGWKIVVLSRLAPGSPFFLLNYLFGVTRIRFGPYLGSTAVSIVPGSFLFVYLGSLGNLALSDRSRSPAEWTLYGAGLIAVVTAVVLVTRRARQVLRRKLDHLPRRSETEAQLPRDH